MSVYAHLSICQAVCSFVVLLPGCVSAYPCLYCVICHCICVLYEHCKFKRSVCSSSIPVCLSSVSFPGALSAILCFLSLHSCTYSLHRALYLYVCFVFCLFFCLLCLHIYAYNMLSVTPFLSFMNTL